MGICVLAILQPNFFQIIPHIPETAPLLEMIALVNNIAPNRVGNWKTQWNLAKQKYVNDIMDTDFRPHLRREKRNFYMDFFGSEYSKLIVHLRNFFIHNLMRNCTTGCQFDGFIDLNRQEHSIFLLKNNNQLSIITEWRGKCSGCGAQFNTVPHFGSTQPNFLIIQTYPKNILFYETPDMLFINNRNFKLLCVTIYEESREHFVSIFRINNSNFYVDGIGRIVEQLPLFDRAILNKRNIAGYSKYYRSFISTALYYIV